MDVRPYYISIETYLNLSSYGVVAAVAERTIHHHQPNNGAGWWNKLCGARP